MFSEHETLIEHSDYFLSHRVCNVIYMFAILETGELDSLTIFVTKLTVSNMSKQ